MSLLSLWSQVYPQQVRVVSFGLSAEELLSSRGSSDASGSLRHSSVELCAGTWAYTVLVLLTSHNAEEIFSETCLLSLASEPFWYSALLRGRKRRSKPGCSLFVLLARAVFLFMFGVSSVCGVVFGCQYQCNQLPGKTRLWNDLYWVGR